MDRRHDACSVAPKRMKYSIEDVGPLNTEEPPPPNPASPDIDWNNIKEEEIDEIVSRLKEKFKNTPWALPTPYSPNARIKKEKVQNTNDERGPFKKNPTSTAT